MKRLLHSIILLTLALPAFTGWFLATGPTLFLNLPTGRLAYWLVTSLAILVLRGRVLWLAANFIALVIALPVVLGGAVLALILLALNLGVMAPTQIAAHYVLLFINMLSMIPLGIALVSLVPTAELETRLLRHATGINLLQKIVLMAVRVFNHVVFAVMPEVLQAVTEELRFNGFLYRTDRRMPKRRRLFIKNIMQKLMFVALTALCTSLKYIHFWVAEISALPGKKQK